MADKQIVFTVFEGPNLIVPFAAIVAEFENPMPGVLPAHQVRRLVAELVPTSSSLKLEPPKENTDFASLVAAFAREWQEQVWRYAPMMETASLEAGKIRIASSFYDPNATKNLLQAAISFTNAVFLTATGAVQPHAAAETVERLFAFLRARPMSIATATLIRLAAKRGIPSYAVAGRALCLFGQGSKGVYFSNMSSQDDSHMGWTVSANKVLTTRFLRQLGLPATEQEVATDAASVRRIAARLGFPLVVKPTDRSTGVGVSVDITSDAELAAAYERARAASRGGEVLIERFVEGDDHRLTVFSGKLMRVTRLLPPRITGDGRRTIAELIEEKNREVPSNAAALGFFSGHKIDAEMIAILAKQGLAPDNRPPEGMVVQLRNTSNLHTGGSSEDVTAQIHPDNAAMAEAIARTLRLGAVGIDFITPDIGKAWHETDCAIIEVNTNPGVRDEPTLERMLAEKFPEGTDGRIPSVLIVGADADPAHRIVEHLAAGGHRVGYTDAEKTFLAGKPRFAKGAKLTARIKGLLMDASCDALVVAMAADAIAAQGLPCTRYDICLAPQQLDSPSALDALLAANATHVVRIRNPEEAFTAFLKMKTALSL